jgi:hypothetical protein
MHKITLFALTKGKAKPPHQTINNRSDRAFSFTPLVGFILLSREIAIERTFLLHLALMFQGALLLSLIHQDILFAQGAPFYR